MSRAKKIFLMFVGVFVLVLGYAIYDIGKRTTFPGSKPQLRERLREKYSSPDSALTDSIGVKENKN
ncbi:hypothetical protein [Chryseolinea sp. H1M3-3]|uniref:hypothetical protein n=1 Tax=Chryseolinea sp. H1M3-3 TaxID=3034144 RepID=UPI0023EB6DCB|nr:hypothetical protein [Chryseolinea sp. H1M3-3]